MSTGNFLTVLLFVYLHIAADGQSSRCKTPNNETGFCKSLYDCGELLALVKKQDRTQADVVRLQKSQCGYENGVPKVCCPGCTTPDGQPGDCISIYNCTRLTNLLRPPVSKENRDFVINSRCNGVDQYGVCCGLPAKGNCGSRVSAFPPDPQTECCGVDGRFGNKITGGNVTTIDQYPWLAMIEYVKGSSTSISLLCGAALISGRYVLTAGHCVTGSILDIGAPTNVRLGEYDTGNEGPDCIPVEASGVDCTMGVTIIPIEKVIPHPEYNPVSPMRRNDIALIRMTKLAPYTDFIRPICLPRVDVTLSPPPKFTLYAAGWGAVSTTQPKSKIKLHVDLPYVTPTDCEATYSKRRVTLWEKQMCAGGEAGKDSCKGDSGGPLMYENERIYEVVGIVSFGPLPCGLENVPGVYSKVYEYRDWIKNTITA